MKQLLEKVGRLKIRSNWNRIMYIINFRGASGLENENGIMMYQDAPN